MIATTLTELELNYASEVADTIINETAPAIGAKSRMGVTEHKGSCEARLAWHKVLGKEWKPNTGKNPIAVSAKKMSLELGCRVRIITSWAHNLIVRQNDEDDAYMVLCLKDKDKQFKFIGWLLGAEAKDSVFFRSDLPYPAFVIPKSKLNPIEELITILKGDTQCDSVK